MDEREIFDHAIALAVDLGHVEAERDAAVEEVTDATKNLTDLATNVGLLQEAMEKVEANHNATIQELHASQGMRGRLSEGLQELTYAASGFLNSADKKPKVKDEARRQLMLALCGADAILTVDKQP